MMEGQPVVVDVHEKNGVRPPFTMYIGRAVRGTEFIVNSRWANIFPVEKHGERSLPLYERYIRQRPRLFMEVATLTNQVLGCWCGNFDHANEPLKCHGQVLIKLWLEIQKGDFPVFCEHLRCKFFVKGFCTYSPLGCHLDDEEWFD